MKTLWCSQLALGTVLFGTVLVGATGCGGSDEAESASTSDGYYGSGSEAPPEDDDVEISGLMGTISTMAVEGALQPRMGRFMRCFQDRMGTVEFLGGDLRMSFRIHTDGSVAWVYPSESDVGDRESEQCVIGVARAIRFPRPQGGEAEFNWGFGFDPPSDVREPLNWAADALVDQQEDITSLRRDCIEELRGGRGSYSITAYIEPGGDVLAAGGSMPNADSDAALECILERVRQISMPDPGSYAAKVTFPVR